MNRSFDFIEPQMTDVKTIKTTMDGVKRKSDSVFTTSSYAESIFETAREPLLLLDEHLRIRAANRAFCETLRAERSVIVGQRFFEVSDGRWNVAELRQSLENVFREQRALQDFELKLAFPHIGERILLINARLVVASSGAGKGICLAMQDVTERLQAQRTMQRLNEVLEERVRQRTAELETTNSELEAFSYSVSHDLRSPLRALDGFARIILEEFEQSLPAEAQEYVHDIRRNAKKMGHLIDDLLAFSRLSRQGLEKRTVSMNALVRQVLLDFRGEQETRLVEVVFHDLPPCQGDPSLLKQVWVNLLGNAFKYTRKSERPRIEIGCHERDGQQVYFVRDNGVGFDMQYAGKLFGVFQRLHKASDFDGTGVGLAIVQRIIHRHGGRIWADAAVHQGATFSFTLPAGDPVKC